MSVCQAKRSKEKHSQEKSCNIMQSKYLILDISNVQTYKISVFSLLRLYGTLCVLVCIQLKACLCSFLQRLTRLLRLTKADPPQFMVAKG